MTKEEWVRKIQEHKDDIKNGMRRAMELSIEKNDNFAVFICDDGEVITDRSPYDYTENLNCEKIKLIEWDWCDLYILGYLRGWNSFWGEFFYNEFLEQFQKN